MAIELTSAFRAEASFAIATPCALTYSAHSNDRAATDLRYMINVRQENFNAELHAARPIGFRRPSSRGT
jgi:hypothetical protein